MAFFDYPEDMRGRLIIAARGLLGWSQEELIRRTGVARQTVTNFERELPGTREGTQRRIIDVLEAEGVEFHETTGRIGVFLSLKDDKQS
jgi:transcriptional regulator with XRE-family HTH domain